MRNGHERILGHTCRPIIFITTAGNHSTATALPNGLSGTMCRGPGGLWTVRIWGDGGAHRRGGGASVDPPRGGGGWDPRWDSCSRQAFRVERPTNWGRPNTVKTAGGHTGWRVSRRGGGGGEADARGRVQWRGRGRTEGEDVGEGAAGAGGDGLDEEQEAREGPQGRRPRPTGWTAVHIRMCLLGPAGCCNIRASGDSCARRTQGGKQSPSRQIAQGGGGSWGAGGRRVRAIQRW